jgi:MFS family permease
MPAGPPAPASRASLHGLDGLNFFAATFQTGFGPFIAVYLTTEKWTQIDIGLVLTVAGAVTLIGQTPAGALVDVMKHKRLAAVMAIVAIAGSALLLATRPIFPLVLLAEVLHGVASCLLNPAIAAISLGLVGHAAIGERLGRNACFASIGNGISAAVMGACGRWVSTSAVFMLAAALAVPALLATLRIKSQEIDPVQARGGPPQIHRNRPSWLHGIVDNRPLLSFGLCIVIFHLANAAMLPLTGSIVTMRSGQLATMLIAACIVAPQLVVAVCSPWIGRQAERWGRRPLLLLGFAALPIRGALLAVVTDPVALVAVQMLDGVSAAVLGVMQPLIVADVTRGTGRFNAALGTVGTAAGIGASVSSLLAGYLTDKVGSTTAFFTLAGIAALAFLVVLAAMPETRPRTAPDCAATAERAPRIRIPLPVQRQ